MDKTETELTGGVFTVADGVCTGCHNNDRLDLVTCNGLTGQRWKQHLSFGRVAQSVWEDVTAAEAAGQPAADGTLCGW